MQKGKGTLHDPKQTACETGGRVMSSVQLPANLVVFTDVTIVSVQGYSLTAK